MPVGVYMKKLLLLFGIILMSFSGCDRVLDLILDRDNEYKFTNATDEVIVIASDNQPSWYAFSLSPDRSTTVKIPEKPIRYIYGFYDSYRAYYGSSYKSEIILNLGAFR